jgi:hypothetical protein
MDSFISVAPELISGRRPFSVGFYQGGSKKMPLDWIHCSATIVMIGTLLCMIVLRARHRIVREFIYSGLDRIKTQLRPLNNEQLLTSINSLMISLRVHKKPKAKSERG